MKDQIENHYISHVPNHLKLAKGYLLEQYKNRPNIDGLLTGLVEPMQEFEDKLYEIYENFSLAKAQRFFLDRIGVLVGELRSYRSDDEYKLAILARILINNGGGTPEDIINALRFTFNPKKISYREIYPACSYVFIQSNNINASSKSLVKSITPIGVSNFVIVCSSEENPFMFAECSNELANLKIKANREDKESNAKVQTDNDEHKFEVAVDSLLCPLGYMGFAEVIITKTVLNLGDGNIYFVKNKVPLEMLLTYEDFTINGGSKLAEVIENGTTKETN